MLLPRAAYIHRGQCLAVLIAATAVVGAPGAAPAEPSRYSSAFLVSDTDEVRVAGAGDVNGDGYNDLLVGTPHWTWPYSYGAVQVHLGGPDGIDPEPAWQQLGSFSVLGEWGPWEGGELGASVAGAGDVNGDSYDDILVSEPGWMFWDSPNYLVGRIFVYLGGPDGPEAEPTWWTTSVPGEGGVGFVVDGIGDVNGDGYDDVMYSRSNVGPGLVLGGVDGLQSVDWVPAEDVEYTNLGTHALAGAGDVNLDGYDDVVIGYRTGDSKQALLYLGSAGGLGAEAVSTVSGPGLGSDGCFAWPGGRVVDGGHDANGDGHADVLVGAPAATVNTLEEAGAAYLFPGATEGLLEEPAWMAQGEYEDAIFGWGLAFAGDVNADSFDDALVGERAAGSDTIREGAASLYLGSSTGLNSEPEWREQGGGAYADFGIRLAGLGDTNGDGYDDFAIGADWYTLDGESGAAVFIYEGADSWPEPADDDDSAVQPDDDDSTDDDDSSAVDDDDSAVHPDDDDSTLADDDDSAEPTTDCNACGDCALTTPTSSVLALPLLALAARRRRGS
jgi:hypothetical protein